MKRIVHVLTIAVTLASISGLSGVVYAREKKNNDTSLDELKFKAGDEKGNDKKAMAAEMLIANQEEKANTQIIKLLKKYKGTAMEPDLLLRQAELFTRRAKTDRFLELHWVSEDTVNVAPQTVKNSASKAQMLKAINIYDQIAKRFPHYDKADLVVFNNAFANQQIGNDARSEKLYVALLHDYPNSNLVPDGHLAVGEIQFSRHNFKEALAHFEAIKKYPDSLVYPYGVYKAGWTQYNLRNAQAALKELEEVIHYGRFVKEQGIDARLDLRKEALMDMALFFEDMDTPKAAYKYFVKQAGELDVSPVVLRLTELYKRHSRNQDIRTLLTEFVKSKPESSMLPPALVELMEASEKVKKSNDVVTLIANFSNLCQADSSWTKAQTNPTALKDCAELFQKMTLGYANKWLRIWQKDSSQTDVADYAEKAFSIYFKFDPSSDESAKARFVYAEMLFKRNKFREASENYAISASQNKNKDMAHDARYYAILALEKAVNDKWNDKDEKSFRVLAQEYLTKNPTGKYVLEVEFKKAFIAYEKGRYDEAAPAFYAIGKKFPTDEKGVKSQDLYLDILNIKKDYEGLRDYALDLRKTAKGDRYAKLTKVYEEAYFFIVQRHEEKQNYDTAIDEYRMFVKANPTSNLSQKAAWNIMQLEFKTDHPMEGADAALAYYEKYSDSKEGQEALVKAAQVYESLGQLNQAADVLVRLAKVDKEQNVKWTQLAADFYALANKPAQARGMYENMAKSNDSAVKTHALEQLEILTRDSSDTKTHVALLKQIAEIGHQPQASLAAIYFVEEAYKAGDMSGAFELSKKLIGQEKSGASKIALARARLTQARILAKEFKAQSVKSQIDRIQTVLTLKTEKLSKAQIAYQSAANYGDIDTSILAYNELADCYIHYSDSLREIPIPKGLPENEVEAFKAEMNKLAIPMEEKGYDTKNQAAKLTKNPVKSSLAALVVPQPGTADVSVRTAHGLALETCPSSSKSWQKESLENLITYASNCSRLGKAERVEQLGNWLATHNSSTPWGPFFLSLSAQLTKQNERALWMADLAIKKAPKMGLMVYQKARVAWDLGLYSTALENFDLAIRENANLGDAHLFLADYYYGTQEYKQAASHYSELSNLEADNSVPVVGLAQIKLAQNSPTDAIPLYEKAVSLSPRNVTYRLKLAELYETSLKNYPQALEAYQRLKELMAQNRTPARELSVDVNEKIKQLQAMQTEQVKKTVKK